MRLPLLTGIVWGFQPGLQIELSRLATASQQVQIRTHVIDHMLLSGMHVDMHIGCCSLGTWAGYRLQWNQHAAVSLSMHVATEVQRRAARVIGRGADAIIQSTTGSGKTLAFVIPLLAALKYPPDAYPEDFQAISSILHGALYSLRLSCTCALPFGHTVKQ